MSDRVFLANTTAIDDKTSHANSCNLGCAVQSLSRIGSSSKWLETHGVHILGKVYMKEKLMKGLLIAIPVATVILIILLIVKRKREAMYKERRKFWLQEMRKIIQQDSSLNTGFLRLTRDAASVRAFTSKLITSNLKRMHIIAALGDQQILCYQSRLKNKVQNFYRRIVRIYMHFDLHVIAEQGKSFLLFNKILMNINSLYFCLKWKHGETLSNSHSSDYQKWFWWKSLDC